MTKAMDALRKIGLLSAKAPAPETLFDARLKKLGGVRHVRVARAVLFRTEPSHSAA